MRLIRRLILTLVIIILIPVVAVGILVFSLYDASNNVPEYVTTETFTADTQVNHMISYGLENTATSNTMDVIISEHDINLLLKDITTQFNTSLGNPDIYIKSIYVELSDGQLIGHIPLYAYGFQSVISGTFGMTSDEQQLTIGIASLKVGNISLSKTILVTILSHYLNEAATEEALSSSGLSVDLDMDMLNISITFESLKELLSSFIGESMSLYRTMLDLCFRNTGMINFTLGDNQNLGVGIDVTDLSYNSTDFETIPYPLTYDDVVIDTESLLDDAIIEEDKASLVFQYLVWGYTYSDEETLNYVSTLDLSSVGINNYMTYYGIMGRTPLDVGTIFLYQFPTNPLDLLSGNLSMRLYEEDINQIIYNESPVGTAFAFPRAEDTGYEVSYITIDGIYLDIKANEVDIIIIMNLNGKLIAFKGVCTGDESDSLIIVTDFETLNYGSIVALDSERISVLEFLSTALADIEWIIADAQAETITFNFTTFFTDNVTLQTFYANVNTTTATFTDALDDNGYIAYHFVFTP